MMGALHPFVRRTAIVMLMVVVAATLGAIAVLAADLFPMLFGAVLVAAFLRGLSDQLARRSRLGERGALVVVLSALVSLGAVASWLMVPGLIEQGRRFVRAVPGLVEQARALYSEWFGAPPSLREAREAAGGGDLLGRASAALAISYEGLLAVAVVVIAGIYLATNPRPYVRGLLRLLPPPHRARGREVLESMGRTLQRFLLGRVVSMAAVGGITAAMLVLLGIPMAGLLGLIAGVLTFVPYAGPILATLPIALVAATEGATELLVAVGAYAAIQMLEGFVITPLVQERAVSLPPVLTLAAELLMGMIFGVMGVVISVPLAAASIVFVRMVYVEGILERPTE